MNTMVQDMTWDVIQEVEGSEIQAMSESDAEEVNGAWVQFVAFGAGIAIGIGIAYFTR